MATPASTYDTRASSNGHREADAWRQSTRIVLQPVAAPSVLGLYGFAAATFMVAAYLAGWYGNDASPEYLFPFAATFGGLAQFTAGIVAFRARDTLATAIHGMWGSFWLAYGILYLLSAVGAIVLPTGSFVELGFWFLGLAAITAVGAIAALAENLALFLVLLALAVGAAFLAVANLIGSDGWQDAGAWVLLASAVLAFYAGSAMLLAASYGRTILPTGARGAAGNVPGRHAVEAIEFAAGEPGVRRGQ